jgi:hypothetical protein
MQGPIITEKQLEEIFPFSPKIILPSRALALKNKKNSKNYKFYLLSRKSYVIN